MRRLWWITAVLSGILLAQKGQTQPAYAIRWLPDSVAAAVTVPQRYPDTSALTAALQVQIDQWQEQGHLEAAIDQVQRRDSLWVVTAHLGPVYQWSCLETGQIPALFLAKADLPGQRRDSCLSDVRVSFAGITALRQKLVAAAAAAGYPFARCSLTWEIAGKSRLSGTLVWESGDFITFDTLQLTGNARIAPAYLAYRLQIRPGAPFDREAILSLPDRLAEIPFLKSAGDPLLGFQDQRAQLILPVEPRGASRFDFLIGVLPNSPQTNRLLITGDLEAELYNPFGAGERLYASYERLRPETQELQLELTYPFVLGLPFGFDGSFGLYRRDTTFLNIDTRLGVQYFLGGRDQLEVFYTSQATNLLRIDTAGVIETGQLPPQLDTRRTGLGLGLRLNRLDYQFNPRRGWDVQVDVRAGIRRILRNNDLERSSANTLYDALEERTAQYTFQLEARHFLPLFDRSTVLAGVQLGSQLNEAGILRNEQFRLGGNRQLRGFDEEFFFVTHYAVATLEYRLLIGRNAYLFAFLDGAWVENTLAPNSLRVQYPYGLGTGMTFETSAGLFGLSVAVGGSTGLPVDFGAPKVHFGYQSLF